MFVRFRRQVVAEHIGTLGSVDGGMSVRERIAFWAKLPGRLAALGNRVGPDEHAKLYAANHAAARFPNFYSTLRRRSRPFNPWFHRHDER